MGRDYEVEFRREPSGLQLHATGRRSCLIFSTVFQPYFDVTLILDLQ